ncbi:MAG: hypothetical protein A2289_05750 [Deltaproteobacteria bacterium RIFOXYA12_FULL_58_15]|nr:MAG: hypothetical protein A2289_05750 [Deltaproteobacteria bacterium RIFOXYA12_FULL_58_15]OGR13957.1 MAG: hypothetical protein A2341_04510 [Deltaproteobacteria bacterium RIFOXYB12_FULL_58_9]
MTTAEGLGETTDRSETDLGRDRGDGEVRGSQELLAFVQTQAREVGVGRHTVLLLECAQELEPAHPGLTG